MTEGEGRARERGCTNQGRSTLPQAASANMPDMIGPSGLTSRSWQAQIVCRIWRTRKNEVRPLIPAQIIEAHA